MREGGREGGRAGGRERGREGGRREGREGEREGGREEGGKGGREEERDDMNSKYCARHLYLLMFTTISYVPLCTVYMLYMYMYTVI